MSLGLRHRILSIVATASMCWASLLAIAQGTSYYEDSQFDPFQRRLYRVGHNRPHTTLRAYKMDDLRKEFDTDSVLYVGIRKKVSTKARIINNFLNDNFLSWTDDDGKVTVNINPLFDFQLGKDKNQKGTDRTWVNSRGFYIDGNLGRNFWFYTDFSENQADYAEYYDNLSDSLKVVPGQANYVFQKTNQCYDFRVANGYICFNIGKWFDFLIGKTKTFVGDGYRSLLLSDAACAVPTFRMNVTFLQAKYMFQMTQLSTGRAAISNNGYKTKYSFTHFIDWNMGKRFTLGVFENVTMATWRKTGETRGLDWEYLNPFIIFRAGEFNTGSPDKMLVGLTGKVVCTNWLTAYSQIMFNEFRLKEFFGGKGYWSNKYGFQLGLRTTNIFRVDGLDFLAEYNQLRPFCYTQYDGMATYTDHHQSMGHQLGANIKEGIFILNYHHGRVAARAQMNVSKYGDEIPKDTVTYGHDPNLPSTKRKSQYGVKTLQGLETKLNYTDLSASFIINPRSMMNITAGVRIRKRHSERTDEESTHIYAALRWSLKGHYYDY